MSAADLVTVLAEGTFEEQIVEVSAFLSRSQPEASRNDFISKFQRLALDAEPTTTTDSAETTSSDAAKKQQTVSQLVSEISSLGEGTDRELEGAYNLIFSLVSSTQQQSQLVPALISAISKDASSSSADSKNNVKYRILSNLFNSLEPTSALRLQTFNALLSLVSANDDLDYLTSALAALPQWLAQWEVSESDKAACLESVAKALEGAEKEHGQTSKAYQFLLLHLRYISTLPASASTKQAAERTVAAALRLPQLYEFEDLIHIPAVLELKSSASPLFDLLKIFVGGSTADFTTFTSSNSSLFSSLNLSSDDLLHKIRLLDLADLCAQSVSSDVSYSSIASTLKIQEDEVELWVIDVIRAGLVSGKLSQVNDAFRVYKATHRQFGKEQWQGLEKRLVQWQNSINSIVESIAATRGGKLPEGALEVAA
ncbi:putative 26S proteasome regulatory subunit RPN9 (putative) [Pseudozyma hubeiensis]|nr:putative 26S proteasome regulatory subunit RPN9 (putative) [Pseudozyma hubeiensis]